MCVIKMAKRRIDLTISYDSFYIYDYLRAKYCITISELIESLAPLLKNAKVLENENQIAIQLHGLVSVKKNCQRTRRKK